MIPAAGETSVDIGSELKGTSNAARRPLTSGVLPVTVQVALSTVLLATASLMLRTYLNLENLNVGVDRAHVVSFSLDLKDTGYTDAEGKIFLREAMLRVKAIPAIRSAAYADFAIMRGSGFKFTVAPQGVVLPASAFLNTNLNNVSPSFFKTLVIPSGLGAEVFTPGGNAGPYLVVAGGKMTRDEAVRMRRTALRTGMPHDSYIQNYNH